MPDLGDGQSVEIQGSAAKPYILKNVGGVYSCSCPAWRNQSLSIDRRTCKHLRQYRGESAEQERLGGTLTAPAKEPAASKTAPPLLLAHAWDNEQDLTGWLMSEKLDGVRAYWTGEGFLSRQGNTFYAPAWFTKGLPKVPLDGELWIGRKQFQRTVSIVRRQDAGELWRQVLYVVFDAPQARGPFEERRSVMAEAAREDRCPFVRVLYQAICQGTDDLRKELDRIESLGGEGLMLRQPGSIYETGRSHTLLKVKRFQDAEARVVGHLPGAGRHKGRLGALLVELTGGTRFSVGTGFTDAQRENPPAIGSVITFRFQELTDGGVPRFPSFVRVRSDMSARPAQRTLLESADA
jgi:DNA ligase-1